jgi:hypothetical protein
MSPHGHHEEPTFPLTSGSHYGNGEHERRSGRWASAEEYQRKWEDVMAEVKRLLPLVKERGVPLYATEKPEPSRSRQKGR